MEDEYVSDAILSEAIELVVSGMDAQMQMAAEFSASLPNGADRLKSLLGCSYFYGYVTGLITKTAFDKFASLIRSEELGKNTGRLLQSVIANMFFPNTDPDWTAVQAWEAQSVAYGMAEDTGYEDGYQAGVKFADEMAAGTDISQTSLLAAELLKQ